MKNSDGQLYTIEGFAAALIMIITVFLVLNATSVYTAGDTHINDMQLEALGTDALKMMDVAPNGTESTNGTPLQQIIKNEDWAAFDTEFSKIIHQGYIGNPNIIHYNATFVCRNKIDDSLTSNTMISNRNLTGGEHSVRVTKWVIVDADACGRLGEEQAVLVEVLLWRD